MSDVQISRSDIERLAHKLDAIAPDFTDREWMLLGAVFAAAGAAISGARPSLRPPAAGGGRPSALGSWTADEDAGESGEQREDLLPGKIGRASLYDQVLESFTPDEDDDDGDSDEVPKKIGNA